MEIHTRELKRELRNTETDRDLWKDRYILRSMRDGTTIDATISIVYYGLDYVSRQSTLLLMV